MDEEVTVIEGRCACAKVRYQVDGDLECPDGFHQFVGSKAPWFEITDGLPEHDGWPVEEDQA
jgi:hypothetical protein